MEGVAANTGNYEADDRLVLCQQHGTAVQKASPLEKSAALQDYLDHLQTVTTERSYYTTILKECKDSIITHYTVNGTFAPPPRIQANSVPIKAHYSFEYAQQVNNVKK